MEQRRNAIVELVNREGSLSFVQLKEAFPSVSEMTLRTDLKALDQARRVVRVHGGVKSVEVVVGTDDQFGRRTARNASEKQIIAEKAAALLRPNTTVFLDSGSTATAVARCVPCLLYTSTDRAAHRLRKRRLVVGTPLVLEQAAKFHNLSRNDAVGRIAAKYS